MERRPNDFLCQWTGDSLAFKTLKLENEAENETNGRSQKDSSTLSHPEHGLGGNGEGPWAPSGRSYDDATYPHYHL